MSSAVAAVNDNLVLICGISSGGKSASLRNIPNPEGVIYLNCESGKKLPFPSKFKELRITDPAVVFQAFTQAEAMPDVHTIVVDSLTFLMEMFESKYVLKAKDTMSGWSNYQQFFKELMQEYVAVSTKNVIFTAHVQTVLNEQEMVMETKVPVKGALKNNGLEAYFSTVVFARKINVEQLADYKNSLLVISPEEEALGFKYVYQTKITKDTVNHRIRASMGMWSTDETFIDNDADLLLKRLQQYYN
jgi:hypothetical protein